MSEVIEEAKETLVGEADDGSVVLLPFGLGRAIAIASGRIEDSDLNEEIGRYERGLGELQEDSRMQVFAAARLALLETAA